MPLERYARHAAVAVFAAALAAGGSAPALSGPARAAEPCCSDPSRFGYDPLPPDGSVEFRIDAGSPTFEFQSGRSAFRAFRLPASARPYVVELRSFLDAPDSPRRARVFYPVVAVLTDDFLVSRSTDLDALRFDLPVLEQTVAPAYRLVVPVDPSNRRERFLVVFTPAQVLAARPLPAVTAESAAQVARQAWLGAAPYGRLRITVRPLPAGSVAPPPDPAPADPS
jgi:hypothetical protein